MPGAAFFRDQTKDAPVFFDRVMGAHPGGLVAEAGNRFFAGLHAGVVQHDHVDAVIARIEIGRRPVDDL